LLKYGRCTAAARKLHSRLPKVHKILSINTLHTDTTFLPDFLAATGFDL
jgi:hypothetical protein